jgi:hypothetical protein
LLSVTFSSLLVAENFNNHQIKDHQSTEDSGRKQLPIQKGKVLSLTKLFQISPDLWSPEGA